MFWQYRRNTIPAFLRTLAAAVLASAGIVLLSGCPELSVPVNSPGRAAARASSGPTTVEREATRAFQLVNEERVRNGMVPLVRRADLDAVAYAHGRDLVRMNKLSHVGSNGSHLENRLGRLRWIWAGENLARNKGFDDPAREALTGWLASPRHRENMFKRDFNQTGVAAVYDPATDFIYFVQIFVIPSS